MAQKMIRLDDEVYTEVKKRADTQRRSAANLTNYYLRKEFGWLPTPDDNVTPIETEPPVYNIETPEVSSPVKHDISHLFSDKNKTSGATHHIAPAAPTPDVDPELPCCKNDMKPCKHWSWDVSTGEGYINSLSGRFREAA